MPAIISTIAGMACSYKRFSAHDDINVAATGGDKPRTLRRVSCSQSNTKPT